MKSPGGNIGEQLAGVASLNTGLLRVALSWFDRQAVGNKFCAGSRLGISAIVWLSETHAEGQRSGDKQEHHGRQNDDAVDVRF